MSIRKPSVAGQFYPGNPVRLQNTIKSLIDYEAQKQKAFAIVSPHAGYMYSGKVAGLVFSSIEIPKKAVIIGPNHTGYGPEASIMDKGIWEMPMGNVEIDQKLAQSIIENSEVLQSDTLAHSMEHSLEVQVPFLQFFQPDIEIIPIILSGHDFLVCESVAKGIATGVKSQDEDILIIASTDLTHYQSQSIANRQDNKIIEKIEALDAKGLLELVIRENISMCGYMPVTTAILAAKEIGATTAKLIKYMTSGDVSGELSHVVGYAGIIIL